MTDKKINLDNKNDHNDVHNIAQLIMAVKHSAYAITKLCDNLQRAYDSLLRERLNDAELRKKEQYRK